MDACLSISSFHRTRTVIEDYTFLIDQEPLQEGILGANDYTRITYELGEAYRRIGLNEDAAKSWTKLEQQTQDTVFRQLLRQKLQSLEGEPAIEYIKANDGLKSILGSVVRAVGNGVLKWAEKEIKTEAPVIRYMKDEKKKIADLRKPRKKEAEKKKEDLRRPARRRYYDARATITLLPRK